KDFVLRIAVNRPPRPDIASARPATPPFFFYEKVGGELLYCYAPFFLIKKLQKKSCCTYAVSVFIHLPKGIGGVAHGERFSPICVFDYLMFSGSVSLVKVMKASCANADIGHRVEGNDLMIKKENSIIHHSKKHLSSSQKQVLCFFHERPILGLFLCSMLIQATVHLQWSNNAPFPHPTWHSIFEQVLWFGIFRIHSLWF
ncbi:MAG: hypothetical protein RLY35_1426, partial [Bacteroidota bacterium]